MLMLQRILSRIVFFWLAVGTAVCWSERIHKPARTSDRTAVLFSPDEDAKESQTKPLYRGVHEPDHHYVHHKDDKHYHSHALPEAQEKEEEFVQSDEENSEKHQKHHHRHHEGHADHKGQQGNDFAKQHQSQQHEKAASYFDKHRKDQKLDNKELENIKSHEVGEKHGGEMTKEHKVGKHYDKSKGHKSHGFKNVYHKEEYGDHKTFHDELLDNDHHHDYDNHHEHLEHQGGNFSRGFKHDGKKDQHDNADEKHSWGKSGHEKDQARVHRKGGHQQKHHHANKNNKGYEDSNTHRNKHSVHKVRKGTPPPWSAHSGHHGQHHDQIQHYNIPQQQHHNIPQQQHYNIPQQQHDEQPHYEEPPQNYHEKEVTKGQVYDDESPPVAHHHHGGHHYIQDEDDDSHARNRGHHGRNHHHRYVPSGGNHQNAQSQDDRQDQRVYQNANINDEQIEDRTQDQVVQRQAHVPLQQHHTGRHEHERNYHPRHEMRSQFNKERMIHLHNHPRHVKDTMNPITSGHHVGHVQHPQHAARFQENDKQAVYNDDSGSFNRKPLKEDNHNFRYYTRHNG